MMKFYLAGPDVFRKDSKKHGEHLKAVCSIHEVEGLYPLDNEIKSDDKTKIAELIFAANRKMIEESDGILANMEPFRGPSADAGTIWEIGYGYALGKPIVGYSSLLGKDYKDRVESDEFCVEDFGLYDNLMISVSVDSIVKDFESAIKILKKRVVDGNRFIL